MSSAVQAECFLAVAADTIVLMETTSKEVIFTIPCSTVIGWTLQASRSVLSVVFLFCFFCVSTIIFIFAHNFL